MIYLITSFGDKIILYYPRKHEPYKIHDRKRLGEHVSDSDEDDNDEIHSYIMLPRLSVELFDMKYFFYNFVIDDINVHTPNGDVIMQLIKTTIDDGYSSFVRVYKNDFKKLYRNNEYSAFERRMSMSKAWDTYCETGIYVPPSNK